MKKRTLIILVIIVGVMLLAIIHSLGGSNTITRSDGFLVSAKCTTLKCSFLFKGTDTLVYCFLNGYEYTANYHFYRTGNWSLSMNNIKGETINYMFELRNAQAIEGVVEVE